MSMHKHMSGVEAITLYLREGIILEFRETQNFPIRESPLSAAVYPEPTSITLL